MKFAVGLLLMAFIGYCWTSVCDLPHEGKCGPKCPGYCECWCKEKEENGTCSTPVELVVVLDKSGSLNESEFATARTAVKQIIENLINPKNQFSIVTFAKSASLDLPFTANQSEALEFIQNYNRGTTGLTRTNTNEGLEKAHLAFDTGNLDPEITNIVALISDGEDNLNESRLLDTADKLKDDKEAIIIAIAVGTLNQTRLEMVSTSGQVINAEDVFDLLAMVPMLVNEICENGGNGNSTEEDCKCCCPPPCCAMLPIMLPSCGCGCGSDKHKTIW